MKGVSNTMLLQTILSWNMIPMKPYWEPKNQNKVYVFVKEIR